MTIRKTIRRKKSKTTKTIGQTTTSETKTTPTEAIADELGAHVVRVIGFELPSDAAVEHDDLFCLQAVVVRLCAGGHFVGGLLLGNVETTCLCAALSVVTGAVTPDEAMKIVREAEQMTGAEYPISSWEEVKSCLHALAVNVTAATQAAVLKMANERQARGLPLTHSPNELN